MLLSSGSSSSGNIDLGIRLYLRDQFSGPAQKVKNSVEGLKSEFTSFQDNLRSARAMSASIAAIGAGLTMGLSQAVTEGADFLFMMRSVEAITDAASDSMKTLSETVMKTGRLTIFTPEQVASGARFMAMAGQSAETINKTISAAANLAGATLTRLEGKMGAADILTNAMKAFNWADEKSSQMADILTLAANKANVSLTDLGNSLRYASATARNLKIPIQNVTGLLMTLGNAGIQGSMAGTGLDNLMRYLSKSVSPYATKISRSAWESLGLGPKDVVDAFGNLYPLVDILGKIKKASEGMGSSALQNVMQAIFGVRGARPATIIMQSLEQTQGFIDMLNDPSNAGAAAEKMNLMMDSLKGSMLKLASTWSAVKVKLAEAVTPQVTQMFKGLVWMLEGLTKFMGTDFGKAAFSFASTAVVVATAIWGIRAAVAALAYSFRTLNVTALGMTSAVKATWKGMMGLSMAGGAMVGYTDKSGKEHLIPRSNTIITSTGRVFHKAPTGAAGPMIGKLKGKGSVVKGAVGASYIAKSARAGKVAGAAASSVRLISTGARLASIGSMLGRGLLGLAGGPVGIALTALSFGLPYLISKLSSNTSAVDKNTQAIEKTQANVTTAELYSAMAGKNVADVVGVLSKNLERLALINETSANKIIEKLGEADNLEQLTTAISMLISGDTTGKGLNFSYRGGL